MVEQAINFHLGDKLLYVKSTKILMGGGGGKNKKKNTKKFKKK